MLRLGGFRLNDEDGWSRCPNPPPARPKKDCGMHGGPLQEGRIKRRPLPRLADSLHFHRPIRPAWRSGCARGRGGTAGPSGRRVRLLLGDALRRRATPPPSNTGSPLYPTRWLDAVERCYEIAVIWSKQEPEFLLGIFPSPTGPKKSKNS